ncbi:MAG: metallophosphoesterase, partial [Candidatus Methanoplasma sp.]|nr:metallophosphoesterase [Candidatus Methanoplasma sp.]
MKNKAVRGIIPMLLVLIMVFSPFTGIISVMATTSADTSSLNGDGSWGGSYHVGADGDVSAAGNINEDRETFALKAAAPEYADDWLVESANARQSIIITNPTSSSLTEMPVLVRLDGTGIPNKDGVSFYDAEGDKLSSELVGWNPAGTTTYWVKVPIITPNGDTTITAYFSDASSEGNDTSDVWSDGYELVQHFSKEAVDAGKDSTGKNNMTLAGTLSYLQDDINSAATFSGTQRMRAGTVAAGATEVSLSAVIDITSTPNGWIGVLCRDRSGGVQTGDTLYMGFNGSTLTSRVYGGMNTNGVMLDVTVTTGLHMLTWSYNGSTLRVYVDGALRGSANGAVGSILSDTSSPFTIGDYSDIPFYGAFRGNFYDAFVKTSAISTEEEEFRYANYLGDAITSLPIETKDRKINIVVTSPTQDEILEGGIFVIKGILSAAANLSYVLNDGTTVDCGMFAAGPFSINVLEYSIGAQNLLVTAISESDSEDEKIVTITFTIIDQMPPSQPILSTIVGKTSATLKAEITQGDGRTVDVDFHGLKTLTLTKENTKIYSGETTSELPDDLTANGSNDQSEYNAALGKTTLGQGNNPYQIFEITLSDEEQIMDQFNILWTGNTGDQQREVTIFVYNHTQNEWVKAGNGYGTDSFSIEVMVDCAGTIKDGILSLLIWRGLNESLENRANYAPNLGQYDFSLMWTTDTQFYAETPSYMHHLVTQFNWMIENFDELKSKMVINTGDLVNVATSTTQWEAIDEAYGILDDAHIPYVAIFGNHDVTGSAATSIHNNYFPASRFAQNNPYFTANYGSENYYCVLEENGAKILIMGLNLRLSEAEVAWANNVLAEYRDYIAIILTHEYISADGSRVTNTNYSSTDILRTIVTDNDNVRLILCGHWHGANTNLENINGRPVWTILHDYQSLFEGGTGFFRMLEFDIENNLIYVNTYSHSTKQNVVFSEKQGEKAGLYQINKDEFVISFDFGATQTRTLETESLIIAASGKETQIGTTKTLTGPGSVSVTWDNLLPNSVYAWYAVVTNESGVSTVTPVQILSTDEIFVEIETLTLTPGSDESAMNFTWYSDRSENAASAVQITKTSGPPSDAVTITGTVGDASAGKSWHKASVTGLVPDSEYTYRVSNDGVNFSIEYKFRTGTPGSFTFIAVGDPQLTTGNQDSNSLGTVTTTKAGWQSTLDIISEHFPDVRFIAGVGDQVDTADSEAQYANLFAPEQLRSMPFAPAVGNHEGAAGNFGWHYNVPNETAGSYFGNYWYTYNGALFVVLNTAPYPSTPADLDLYIPTMDATLKAATEANPGAKWIFVQHHKSTASPA